MMTDSVRQDKVQTTSLRQDFTALVAEIIRFGGVRLIWMLALVFVASLIEGLGLFLIFPLAGIIFEDLAIEHQALVWVSDTLTNAGLTSTTAKLWLFGGIYLALVVCRAFILLLREAATNDLKNDFINTQRMALFQTLAYAPWGASSQTDRAEILNTLTANLGRLGVCLHFLMTGLVQASQLVILVVISLFISPVLSAAIFIMLLTGGLIARRQMFKSHKIGVETTAISRRMMFETDVFLSGLKAAKVYGAEDAFLTRFRETMETGLKNSRDMVLQQGRSRRALEVFASVLVILVMLIGYSWLGISGPAMIAMVAILLRMAPQIISLVQGAQQVVNAVPAFTASKVIESSIRATSQSLTAQAVSSDQTIDLTASSSIRFDHISVDVSDHGERKTLLHIDELTLPSRGLVMVVGPSGAGKSTFAEVITGLRQASAGTISIDGNPVSIAHNSQWQKQLSFLPQEPFLFNATVRENLSWPDHQLTDADLERGLTAAQAAHIIEGLPRQMDEPLRDNGIRLSGGERQRVCLARALARPARVCVLDEPTANLDRDTEHQVMTGLKQMSETCLIILISHNPDLQSFADLTLRIEAGELAS